MKKRCSRCREEKELSAKNWQNSRRSKDGFGYYCKACRREIKMNCYSRDREKNILRNKAWALKHPRKVKWNSEGIGYISGLLRDQGFVVTPETIVLKRQQIIMKRVLKQFKKWRQGNESNHSDVHRKQLTDEANHEGRI